MNDERKISLCIPAYNRYDLLINSFIDVLPDERIDEIIISDDESQLEIYNKVGEFITGISKIKLYRNEENQDCYKNKMTSLTYAKNKYCILLDSDNTISKDYIDKIFEIENWDNHVAYLPSFAAPHFDYRKYEGRTITKETVSRYIDDPTFSTMLNTANFFVNKDFYIQSWDANTNPNTSDSIFMNYQMLNNGGKLYVVPGLSYLHRVDDHQNEESGHYQKNYLKTGNFHNEVLQKIKELR